MNYPRILLLGVVLNVSYAQTVDNLMSEKKAELSDMQYYVTQECGTEPAFNNEYWNNKEPGIYVDIVSGEALFSSQHKYDSKTGWPSFYQTINKKNLKFEQDLMDKP